MSPTAGALNRTTVGLRIALSVPWCSLSWRIAPSAWLSEWTAPSPFWKRQAAFEGRHHHLSARRHVAAIDHGPLQMAPDAPRPVERNRLGRRNVARREQGLDAVGHRIEPGRGGERRRQPERQLRVADDPIADEVAG